FYTIGQRHGLDVGGGLPYYVTGKDMDQNEVYVTTNLDDAKLWHDEIKLTDVHWINEDPTTINHKLQTKNSLYIRTRYRAPLIKAELRRDKKTLQVKLAE